MSLPLLLSARKPCYRRNSQGKPEPHGNGTRWGSSSLQLLRALVTGLIGTPAKRHHVVFPFMVSCPVRRPDRTHSPKSGQRCSQGVRWHVNTAGSCQRSTRGRREESSLRKYISRRASTLRAPGNERRRSRRGCPGSRCWRLCRWPYCRSWCCHGGCVWLLWLRCCGLRDGRGGV